MKRLAWLLACIGLGLGIGAAGFTLTGRPAWFIAIPAVMAVGWLVFADPSRCESPSDACRPGGEKE